MGRELSRVAAYPTLCFLSLTRVSTRFAVSGRFWKLEVRGCRLEARAAGNSGESSFGRDAPSGRESWSDPRLGKSKLLICRELDRLLLAALSLSGFELCTQAATARKRRGPRTQVRAGAWTRAMLFAAYIATCPPLARRHTSPVRCRWCSFVLPACGRQARAQQLCASNLPVRQAG
jgi:hypothetical protein